MTYASPHIHLAWGGRHYTTDTWSCGLRLWNSNWASTAGQPTAEVGYSNCEAVVDDAAAAINTWVASANTNLGPYSYLDWVKINYVDEHGRQYSGFNTVEYLMSSPSHNAAGTPTNPASSLVVTLTTELTRGRAHAGRLYLPIGHLTVGANGAIDSTTPITNVLTNTKNLINALNSTLPWTFEGYTNVAVMSTRSAKNVTTGPGPVQFVRGLKLGNVLDVQRRRRRQLEEAYTTMSLT